MRDNHSTYSSYAGLAAVGLWIQAEGIWARVTGRVRIKQKKVKHTPHEKLLDALMHILSGGDRLVTINSGIRCDEGLQRAFGRSRCAEQSVVSTTLDRCDEETVVQMKGVLKDLNRAYSQSYGHNYQHQWQLLDVDMTGLRCGRQAEGATKGFFSEKKGGRGRQLGRVTASLYQEIVCEQLYPGKRQLEKSLPELIEMASEVLELTDEQKQRTIIRIDGGGGSDHNLNQLMRAGYRVVAKAHNWQRCRKLAQTVTTWHPDPTRPEREVALVPDPHPYVRDTVQVVIRQRKRSGQWRYALLISDLPTETLCWLARRPVRNQPTSDEHMWALLGAYDKRSGGIETNFKESKQGLGLNKRNKRRFTAQEMLVLLAQLAHNLIVWVRHRAHTKPTSVGIKRFTRDIFRIPGRLEFGPHHRIVKITFNTKHPCAKPWLDAILNFLPSNQMLFYLDKI